MKQNRVDYCSRTPNESEQQIQQTNEQRKKEHKIKIQFRIYYLFVALQENKNDIGFVSCCNKSNHFNGDLKKCKVHAHGSSVARRRKPTAQQRRPVAAVEVRAHRHDMHLSLQRFRYAKLSSRHACSADVHCASNDTRRARRRRQRRRCAVTSRILCRTRSRSSSERPRSQARVASVGDNERSARFVCVSRSQLAEQTVELCRYLRSRRRAASAVQLSILQVVAVERYAASARRRRGRPDETACSKENRKNNPLCLVRPFYFNGLRFFFVQKSNAVLD
jgi:hypothetical protein